MSSSIPPQTIRARFAVKGMKSLGIRGHLAGLVAGCILPIAAVAVFLIQNLYEIERVQLTNSATSRARTLGVLIEHDFASTQAALQVLGTSHRLATGDLDGFCSRALEALRDMQAHSIVVWAADGRMLIHTNQPCSGPPSPAAVPTALRHRMQAEAVGVSDLFADPVTERLTFAVMVPIKREGAIQYWITANMAPPQIARFLSEQRFPDSWRSTIVDSSGSVVARSIEIEKYQGRKVSAALLQSMQANPEGSQEGRTLDGVPVLTVYSRAPGMKWGVILGIPLQDLTAGLDHTLRLLIAATLAALLLGITWAWHFGGRVADSIKGLIGPAKALGAGESVSPPSLHFDEAIELGQALLDAAGTLQQSNYKAHHDPLTGLANRSLFETVVNQQLALCRRNSSKLAILYIDLDGFKAVNDQHGHDAGDLVLCEVAGRIRGAIRESDVAARLGGDEFAVALIQSDMEAARKFATQFIERLSRPYAIGSAQASISASIGIAMYPDSATHIDTLLIKADRAMYQAKALGKGRIFSVLE